MEAATFVVLLAIGSEVLRDNRSVPEVLRLPQPAWARAIIDYPRILQGWRMFAPEPPREEGMIYVDAVTQRGAHVDPYNEVASDQPFPAGRVVPRHMGQSHFFVMYSDRIANVNYAAYRQAFEEWLLRYPERTGKPEDCLVSYEVYWVLDESPPFGSTNPKPREHKRFMTYRAPAGGPCRQEARTGKPGTGSPTVPAR